MSRPIKKIYDCATGETVEREFTDEEFAQHQADQAAFVAQKAEAEAQAAAKAALLERLGLTEEEARILLGGN